MPSTPCSPLPPKSNCSPVALRSCRIQHPSVLPGKRKRSAHHRPEAPPELSGKAPNPTDDGETGVYCQGKTNRTP